MGNYWAIGQYATVANIDS